MKALLELIDRRTHEYAEHPLFVWLKDESVSADRRLQFVPSLAHFVMSFADLYALVLRHEPPQDRFQELVNAHTYEDGGHWKWFLTDLKTLSQDPVVPFSESLRFVWADRTAPIRMLTYQMCKLGLGATTLEKLVLVHCIEAGGKVALSSTVPAAVAVARKLGRDLLYFGTHHIDTELQHTVEAKAVQDFLNATIIDDAVRPRLIEIVEQSFVAFAEFARGVLDYDRAGPWQPRGLLRNE
jgi:hypothetical protein